jgi:Exostosin family.
MALVHILSTAPIYDATSGKGSGEIQRVLDAVPQDRFGIHKLTNDPAEAGLILFVDSARPDLRDIRDHAIYKSYIEKCFVMHYGDRIFPFLPGIFTCPEKGSHPSWRSRTGSYLTVIENQAIRHTTDYGNDPVLFSFVGRAATSKVRQEVMALQHPRAVLIDTSRVTDELGPMGSSPLSQSDYARIMLESRFVLCPKGLGSSTFRLFETLKAGRVPVIISDAWIPPLGPEWERFALFVRESRIAQIPRWLEAMEPRAVEMGLAARAAWEDWFSGSVVFHRSVEWCLQLLQNRPFPEKWCARYIQLRRFRPVAIERRMKRLLASERSPLTKRVRQG